MWVPARRMLGGMRKPVSGGAVFLLCLFVGIIADQVALGILAGLFLGAFTASRKTKAPEQGNDGQS